MKTRNHRQRSQSRVHHLLTLAGAIVLAATTPMAALAQDDIGPSPEVSGSPSLPVPVAVWALDGDGRGAPGDTLTFVGGYEFGDDAVVNDGLTAYGGTGDPGPLDTTSSYTAAAWVTLDDPAEYAVAISQIGDVAAAFFLGVAEGAWSFSIKDQDTNEPGHTIRALADPSVADPDAWVHVVGVFDGSVGEIRFYLDGERAAVTPFDAPWQAGGRITVGGSQANAGPANFWPGAIADARVYQTALTDEEVRQLRDDSWSVDGDRFTLALLECVPQSGAGNCDDDIADVGFMTEHTYTSSGSDPTLAASASSMKPLHYVAFGDSWPYGAHCDGCRPFPVLYAEGLEASTGQPVEFTNLVTNGGTAAGLLRDMQVSPMIREAVAAADIIVISIGANDMEPAFEATIAGECGGVDGMDCWRAIAEILRVSFDGILTEIDDLRDGQPTVVRIVTDSNAFLTDPFSIETLGADFARTEGVAITKMNRDVECDLAADHGAACVDLGPVFNGPDLLIPSDLDAQDEMYVVADAILASGLDELG